MTAPVNRIQLAREQVVFAKKETTAGTIVYPASTDLLTVAGAIQFNQQPSYTDSPEVRDSRSLKDRFVDKNPAGQWSVPQLARPSGTAGTAPDGDVLFECALGTKTTVANTSVAYTPAKDLSSFTLAVGMRDMVYWMTGATVNDLKVSITNKGAIQFDYSGGFMAMIWAGAAELSAYSSNVVTLNAAGDYMKYKAGAKVKFLDATDGTWKTNSGAGYTILSVSSAENKITLTSAVSEFTPAAGDHVFGFLPTGTEVGEPVECRNAVVKFDAVEVPIKSCDFTLSNAVKYEEEEISTAEGPTAYIADRRSVVAATSLWFRTNDLKYFRKALDRTEVAMLIIGGTVAGNIITISIPHAVGSVPAIAGDLEKELAIDFVGLASASLEDEVSITFT